MFSDRRCARFESLELRTLLCGTLGLDICLLQQATDASWHLRQSGQTEQITDNSVGLASNFAPEVQADFTGDGITDVLGRRPDRSWWLQVNDGTQFFDAPFTPLGEQPIAATEVLGAFDLDNDTKLDVLSLDHSTGEIWGSINNTRFFDDQMWGTFAQNTSQMQLFVDDFDGDGLIDLLAGDVDGRWRLARNTGSNFEIGDWGAFPQFNWQDVVSGDFTGDGLPDVAARAPDHTWWMWEGTETGLAPATYWGHWKMRSDWHDVGVADFNNDGRDDLIGRTDDGRLWVGSAIGSRFHTWRWATGWVASAEWSQVTIIDVNGDGLADQVGHAKDDTWWYAQNTGSQFLNSFWLRGSDTPFTAIVKDMQSATAVDVVPFLPEGGTNLGDSHLRASLNDQNKIVLTGTQVSTHGLELLSASGSLVPIPSGDTSAPADPFQILLSNAPTNVTFASLTLFDLSGELVLDVGWDPDSTAEDLIINYGATTPLRQALVAAPLGNDVTETESQTEINRVYFESIPNLDDFLSP